MKDYLITYILQTKSGKFDFHKHLFTSLHTNAEELYNEACAIVSKLSKEVVDTGGISFADNITVWKKNIFGYWVTIDCK